MQFLCSNCEQLTYMAQHQKMLLFIQSWQYKPRSHILHEASQQSE
jgi:hypothetical protein